MKQNELRGGGGGRTVVYDSGPPVTEEGRDDIICIKSFISVVPSACGCDLVWDFCVGVRSVVVRSLALSLLDECNVMVLQKKSVGTMFLSIMFEGWYWKRAQQVWPRTSWPWYWTLPINIEFFLKEIIIGPSSFEGHPGTNIPASMSKPIPAPTLKKYTMWKEVWENWHVTSSQETI